MGNIDKFNLIASHYDTPERIRIAEIIAGAIKEYIESGKEKTAIDYGCGTGLVGMQLLDDFKSILFIDASGNMVEEVTRKINKSNIFNASVLQCDLMAQNGIELSTDYIIMAQTLIHIKDVERILSNLYNILNSCGHLIIVDFDKNDSITSTDVHNGFVKDDLIRTLKGIGFVKAEAKTFYHGSKLFMNQDASLFILDAIK